MPKSLEPNPAELLAERLSDRVLQTEKYNRRLLSVLEAANVAIPCVYRAAAAGNVQCKEAMIEIEKILKS